jgi:hypothetical protein
MKWLPGTSRNENGKEGAAMKCNVGTIDRIVRVILGMAILTAGFYFRSWWGLLGLVPLVTAAVSFCPLYRLVRISTCRSEADTSTGEKASIP